MSGQVDESCDIMRHHATSCDRERRRVGSGWHKMSFDRRRCGRETRWRERKRRTDRSRKRKRKTGGSRKRKGFPLQSLYFGYTPLIPLPSAKVPMKESLRKNLCRSLGILWNDVVDYPFLFEWPAVAAAFDFLIHLANKESILSDNEWDLCRANRSPISLSARFKCFHRVFSTDTHPETLYMLDLKEQRSASWYLV